MSHSQGSDSELGAKLDALRYLAQAHREEFRARRRIEWRVVFTILAFYVLSVVAVYDGRVMLTGWLNYVVSIMMIIIAAISAFFLSHMHMANNTNKSIAENAENSLAHLLYDPQNTIDPNSLFTVQGKWTSWSSIPLGQKEAMWGWIWQVATIGIVALTAAILIASK